MDKYTVIIPTRDRAETLGSTLRTCLRQTYKNFEVIVSDNCSSDHTRAIVESFNDPRVRYVNPGRPLSMSGNFEFALGQASDGFVMIIGADDGIMPDAIEYVASIVRKHGVDAVACRQATYVWPNFPDSNIAGRLIFGGPREDVEVRNSSEWIDRALNFESFYCFDLPSLYCGFVHTRIIEKAYIDGVYFRSITPDAYSAFATAIFVDKYAFSHRPFSIAGASPKSTGTSTMHPSGASGESDKFLSENDIPQSDGFVYCPSFEVASAEAFSCLAQAFPEMCSPHKVNYAVMLGSALSSVNSKTKPEVTAAVKVMAKNFATRPKLAPHSMLRLVGKARRKVYRTLVALLRPSRVIGISRSSDFGVRDIDDAALVAHVMRLRVRGGVMTIARGLLWHPKSRPKPTSSS